MKRTLLAAAMLAATASGALAASANETLTLRSAGYWSAYYDAANSGGQPMCGLLSRMDFKSGASGSFMVKYAPGGAVFVHLFKSSWAIPKGTRIPISLKFDNGEPLTTTAGGSPAISGSGGGFVEFEIKEDFTKDFLELFASANTLTVGFGSGSEPPWAVNMIGSRETVDAFGKCVATLAARTPSTQPYGSSGPTQPFGNGGAQPFGNTAKPAPANPASPAVRKDNGGI